MFDKVFPHLDRLAVRVCPGVQRVLQVSGVRAARFLQVDLGALAPRRHPEVLGVQPVQRARGVRPPRLVLEILDLRVVRSPRAVLVHLSTRKHAEM